MSTWILIFWIIGSYDPALSSVRFQSKDSCEKALQIVKSHNGWNSFDGFCIEDNPQKETPR